MEIPFVSFGHKKTGNYHSAISRATLAPLPLVVWNAAAFSPGNGYKTESRYLKRYRLCMLFLQ